ncbi:hypothetical protein IMCC3317_18440 [Kordia antarctica]|uniref:Uncharacterized protein n=1 Tax=Kordia antarctica TaxID=1218801 RepID=A0A7L4ZJ04_9FLAO|nr:hypothetical protein [Kordia antarctica]QHI36481.1 hypothetical protein IMCC3317_18440 [Kordia antarctica]
MKKIVFILLLLPVLAISQKIKIKKNKILFDKKEVAIFEDGDERNKYTFKYLSGEKAFDAAYKAISVSAIQDHQYVEMTSADGKKTEIPYEILQTSFSSKKIIIRLLSQKYNMIDANGINKEAVAAFFAEERESISEKYMQAAAAAKLEADERKQTVGRYKPYVKPNGTITFGGSQGTKIVGKVYYSASEKAYAITDLDGIKVATAEESRKMGSTAAVVKTYTDETFEFDEGSKTMFTGRFSRTFGQLFVESMVGRGYVFGRQAKKQKSELHKEKVKIAKENSVNLYGVSGSVTDKKGKKYDGTVYVVFEKLELEPGQQVAGLHDMNSIDNFGKDISIRYENDKGRTRIKKFSAKDGISFTAMDEGVEKTFHGMKTKGNALKKLSNATNFGFNNSYFYEEIYEENGHMLLVKPGEEGTYVIKVKDEKSGFMIDDRNNEKISKALAKYLGKCKQVASDLKAGEFDVNNEENLKQIIQEYNDCGK